MLKLVESFSAGVRLIVPVQESDKILNQFSVGILDRRYPRGPSWMFKQFSVGYTTEVDHKPPKFIRVK